MFRQTLNDELYVDKSMMIDSISKCINNAGRKYVCITRPRRFGKTINANMLGAYYTKGYDSHDIFRDLYISQSESYEKHMNRHNVIHIDFSDMPDTCENYKDYISYIRENLYQDLFTLCPSLAGAAYKSLSRLLFDSGQSFIFILDEWDCIFYQDFMGKKERDDYLRFLKNLLKDQPYV